MVNKFNPKEIRLIVGLGNPGKKYEKTYHNAGEMFVSKIATRGKEKAKFKKYAKGKFAYAEISGLILIKPLCFMNESGVAVKNAISFFKCSPEQMIVVHDENDLSLGKYKIDFGKGSAGHNGISSIIKTLGGKNFWRMRLGIQPEMQERKKAGDFVLTRFSSTSETTLENLFEEIISSYFP